MQLETTSGARISPIAIKPEMKIKILDEREIEKIHEATRVVLHKPVPTFISKQRS